MNNNSNEFEILGIPKNATPEDIQLSFAYLYQMIDLLYPLGGDREIWQERNKELKKLELAYLSAMNYIRKKMVSISDCWKESQQKTLSELSQIEILFNRKKGLPFISSENKYYCSVITPEIKNKKLPFFSMDGKEHRIFSLSKSEMCTESILNCFNGNGIKGELYMDCAPALNIAGKIIRQDEQKTTIKLVTMIADKWIEIFKTQQIV